MLFTSLGVMVSSAWFLACSIQRLKDDKPVPNESATSFNVLSYQFNAFSTACFLND
jgi:hypothetical protein